MQDYYRVLSSLVEDGNTREDRTGTGVLGLFGEQMRFNLGAGFPLVTRRKMHFQGIIDELLWFISGSTNMNMLPKRTQHWWEPWARPNGELGPIYGQQLRASRWVDDNGTIVIVDQLARVIRQLKANPYSRRHVINLWHTPAMETAQLPCCHGTTIQFYVDNKGRLSCSTYQRSADAFIGLPVNIASYALLTHLIAAVTGLGVGELIYNVGDVHLYKNHIDAAKELLCRVSPKLPELLTALEGGIDDVKSVDIGLQGYNPLSTIKAQVSV